MMDGKTITYRAEGGAEASTHNSPPGLDFLQEQVGGYIESVPHLDKITIGQTKVEAMAFCNEEGKLRGLPVNEHATKMWADCLGVAREDMQDVLVGDVVLVYGDPEFMAGM